MPDLHVYLPGPLSGPQRDELKALVQKWGLTLRTFFDPRTWTPPTPTIPALFREFSFDPRVTPPSVRLRDRVLGIGRLHLHDIPESLLARYSRVEKASILPRRMRDFTELQNGDTILFGGRQYVKVNDSAAPADRPDNDNSLLPFEIKIGDDLFRRTF